MINMTVEDDITKEDPDARNEFRIKIMYWFLFVFCFITVVLVYSAVMWRVLKW